MIEPSALIGDPAGGPRVDLDTYIVADHAVVALADRRYLPGLDAVTQCHLLASLIAQADQWLDEQVGQARDNGATWRDVGRLVGMTATAARQRWATPPPPTRTRRPQPPARPGGTR